MKAENSDPEAMNDLLALSHVPRWAIVPHIGDQTVAEHSHRVAIIMMELAIRLGIQLTPFHYIWALVHDGAEAWSGDISGIFKANSEVKEAITKREGEMAPWFDRIAGYVPDNVRALVKLCDIIETYTFIVMRGYGRHATDAAERNFELLREKVGWFAPDLGYGPTILWSIVESLLQDINTEKGRRVKNRGPHTADSPQSDEPNPDPQMASSSAGSCSRDDKPKCS